MNRRAGVAMVLALIGVAIFSVLAAIAVAAPVQVIEGYEWVHDPERPTCERVEWHRLDVEAMLRAGCSFEACAVNPDGSKGCGVVSIHAEEVARSMRVTGPTAGYGETLFDHEARHVLQRLAHPSRRPALLKVLR